MVSFLRAFLPKLCMHPSPMCATCPAHPIPFIVIIPITFGEEYKLWTYHYAVSSSTMLHHPSLVQIFSSAPCSQTPSVYVPSSMWKTNFILSPSHTTIRNTSRTLATEQYLYRRSNNNTIQNNKKTQHGTIGHQEDN
jgi:hypothetical protein